jgi:hypothetical protein
MSLLSIILILVVVGVLLYLINNYIPMDANIKKILNITAVVIVIVWLLKVAGALAFLSNVTI